VSTKKTNVKTPAQYLTQAILWLQTKEATGGAFVSALLCWLMQAKCKGGSKTAHTDGVSVWINEEWFASMSIPERGHIFAHEAAHGILGHVQQITAIFGKPTAAGASVFRRANVAWDAWINCVLSQMFDFRLPDVVYPDRKLPGSGEPLFRDAELFNPDTCDWLWLYQRLHKDAGGEGGGAGSGDDVIFTDDPAIQTAADNLAKRAIAQGAARAAGRGLGGGWAERLFGQASQPVQDWRSQLWDVMASTSPQEWSSRRCNKSYAAAGGLVGTLSVPGIGAGVVAFDTSGSMTDDVLSQPVAEANAVVQQCRPDKLYVLSVDAHVANAQEVDDVFIPELKGGGGTSFIPAFEWVKENAGEDVGFLLYFTDGYGDWQNVEPPDYPVIWFIVAGGTSEDPPFGRVIRMMAG